jgi:FkbM family methyltransferase
MRTNPRLKRIGLFALPIIARPFAGPFANNVIRSIELASCLLQGKGSGTGWDMPSEVSVAATFIKTQTPVLLDVGANVGDWSTMMLRLFPQCSNLLLVEPQPECGDILAKIKISNKKMFPCAVADKSGDVNFYTAEQKDGWDGASLFERLDTCYTGVSQRRLTVPIRKIDDIVEEVGITKVDFMKMDIEGAELMALKGAEDCLRKGTIRALSFEFGSGNINSRTYFRDFWDFLGRYEFAIFRVLPGGKLLRINEYHESLECFYRATNYIASR